MEANPHYWRSKRVCVTGGTGFLGWHLVTQLAALAGHVRVFGLPPRSAALRERLRAFDCVHGDVRDASLARAALSDCDIVFHAAGPVAVWGPALKTMRDIHLAGTRNVLAALPEHARLVHTSSVVAIGASRRVEVLSEASPFNLHRLKVDYVHVKRAAETLARTSGRDVVVVNPAYLIGPEDHEGSVMGRLCLRSWKGKMPLVPRGGFNFVDVRDAAFGHLLAAERGRAGERYILGGENLTLLEFVKTLARVRGTTATAWRMPHWLHFLIACGAEARAGLVQREPYPSLQQMRMSRYFWYYTSQCARAELGYEPRSVEASLRDTHDWFCRCGQLTPPDRWAAAERRARNAA